MDQTLPRTQEPLSELAAPKPVLFLHIPKTGGTSLLLTLQNTFGDNHVRRIRQVDEHIGETVQRIVDHELSEVSCLAGHLPIHLFENTLDRFHPFTVLREPVARVLSVYRFIRQGDAAVPRRLGLPPDFSLAEFLNCGHPEVYGQVNNGMVRMLCGNPRLFDPGSTKIWDISGQVETLERAVANLERIDFGLAEAMPATLALAGARWGVPYELSEYRENVTAPDASSDEVALIHRIVAMNTADIALSQRARQIFHERVRQLPPSTASADWNPRSVFVPEMNRETSIADIPGRRGFHECEADGFAWMHADQESAISFVADADLVRLRLQVYCIVPDYPTHAIEISANAVRLQTQISPQTEGWCSIETEHFETRRGLNQATIRLPLFFRLETKSNDGRRLGIAIARIETGP